MTYDEKQLQALGKTAIGRGALVHLSKHGADRETKTKAQAALREARAKQEDDA